MSKFSLTISTKTETLENIPIRREGFKFSELVGAEGKHAEQSMKIKVQDRNVMNMLIEEKNLLQAKVFRDNVCIFEGVIKPYVSISASQAAIDSLSLEIFDFTELLDKEVFTDLSLFEGKENQPDVVLERTWKNATVKQILDDLFALCGVTDYCSIEYEYSWYLKETFDDFRIVNGDNLKNVISQLCYEAMLDFRFSPGKVSVYNTNVFKSDVVIKDYRLRAKVNRGKDKEKGISLTYRVPSKAWNVNIYHEDSRFDDSWDQLIGTGHHAGYYYEKTTWDKTANRPNPPTKLTAMWNFQDLKSKEGDISIIGVEDAKITAELHDEVGVDYSGHLDHYDEHGGCAYIAYDGQFDYWFGKGWGFEYDVNATVLFKKSSDVSVSFGIKPKKIALKYVESYDWALAFGNCVNARQEQAVVSYDFTSNQYLEPGHCYVFQEDSVMGIKATVRILSVDYDFDTNLYSYKAEGSNAVELVELKQDPDTGRPILPALPPEVADFFYILADRTLFLKEESSEVANVSAYGFALAKASKVDWILNGDYLDVHESSVKIPVPALILGNNVVTCRIIAETVPYERTVNLIKTNVTEGTIVQYRWGADPANPPITDGGLWFWNGKLIFLDGKIIGNMNDEAWLASIPGKTEGTPYLWMRVSTDSGKTWTYTRLPGTDDVSFAIVAEPSFYPWSVRGATVAVNEIALHVDKRNTIGSCSWSCSEASVSIEPSVGDNVKLTIPSGFQPKSIVIKATIDGIGTKESVINAAEIGSKLPVYVGAGLTLDQLEAMPTNPLGFPWIEGDHALVILKNGDREDPVPYVYKEKAPPHWMPLEKTTPNIAQIMNSSLYDIVDHGNMDMTNAAVYGFFEKLAAVYALIENLDVRNLRVFDTSLGEPNLGMFVHITARGEDNLPLFVVKFKGKTLFQVSPTTGNLFFGEPNETLTAPVTGFMYNAEYRILTTRNNTFTLYDDGRLKLSNVDISGNAVLNDSFFNGEIDCPSFSSLKGSAGTPYSVDCPSSARNQFNTITDFANTNFGRRGIKARCSLSVDPAVKYCDISGGAYSQHLFYDGNMKEIGKIARYSSSEYSSTWKYDTFTLTVITGGGDIFKFKNLPFGSSGLDPGQVYVENGFLKLFG